MLKVIFTVLVLCVMIGCEGIRPDIHKIKEDIIGQDVCMDHHGLYNKENLSYKSSVKFVCNDGFVMYVRYSAVQDYYSDEVAEIIKNYKEGK